MKNNNAKKKGGGRKGNNLSTNRDPFFNNELSKRRKIDDDGEIESDYSEEVDGIIGGEERVNGMEVEENKDEMRKRVADEYLNMVRKIAAKEKEDKDDSEEDGEKEGEKDSLVAQILKQEQLEESGRVRKAIASKVQSPGTTGEFQDGTIMHWDVNSGKSEKYRWPSDEVLKSHGVKDPHGRATKHSKNVLTLAVSSDGRYLASGGLDRHVHLWDIRTREHIQAFPGHRGPVSCLTFREGTSELFSGSFDRTVKIWNAEDRTYMNTLFGHQSEILNIDCLRKERVLTVGRDRSMQLFKVHEESRLVFRAPASSLECCCFINNDEFLSGTDDGSIELWSVMRKKPAYIVRNAHALPTANINGRVPNESGDHHLESCHFLSAYSWVSSVTVCRNSDLAVSGAGNGSVRLWAVKTETKDIRPLYDVPLVGFVNSLAFAKSGEFLVAGVGQEPRLGRWGCTPRARNGIAVHSLKLS
ncbi:U3 snoRNP-associated protein-like [Quillaja saponaria]|uniref:U3 snoRNP-associated protein-like n=1 Tax=Quillaja saponaria TaxID=32244 RepID=A0AAD7LBT6_QUISA|nr:U3 snoRNP-associated protein-like [Quillaja saponaria]